MLLANVEAAQDLLAGDVYDRIAGQIAKLKIDEERCFERVNVRMLDENPQFDVDTTDSFLC